MVVGGITFLYNLNLADLVLESIVCISVIVFSIRAYKPKDETRDEEETGRLRAFGSVIVFLLLADWALTLAAFVISCLTLPAVEDFVVLTLDVQGRTQLNAYDGQ